MATNDGGTAPNDGGMATNDGALTMTLTSRLVQLVRAKPVDDADRRRAALLVLDAVANAIAGRRTDAGERLWRWGKDQGQDAGRRALVAGGLTHILEIDDLHRASVTHPGCVVVPAALSVGLPRVSSGHALLDSVLQGYEACCRVGMAVGPSHYRYWHNTATCGPFGSALAVAALLELSDAQAVHALGNAGTQAAGLWEFLQTGAMSKHLHAGRAAEAGVVAAELAAVGFTGAPAILEGARGLFAAACPDGEPEAVIRSPTAPWQLHETSIKPWPSCRHTHPAIDAALQVHRQLSDEEITSVTVSTYGAALDLCDRPQPASQYEAKFSLQHCVAVALMDGSVELSSFDTASRERLAKLGRRVVVDAVEPFVSEYPRAWGARVTVITTTGGQLRKETRACKGDPENPLSADEMVAKAHCLLDAGRLQRGDADALIEEVLALADDRTPRGSSWDRLFS